VLIDPVTWYLSGCGCGGVAYIGVYDIASHNVGLNHDGTASVGYYEGHGSWAPIMGVGS
jgi:hypothetical protein